MARTPLTLAELSRDLDRLTGLTDLYVRDGDDDLDQAVARIPGDAERREAGELLERIRPVIGPHLAALAAAFGSPLTYLDSHRCPYCTDQVRR